LATAAALQLLLAHIGGLQESELKRSYLRPLLLCLGRERRNAPIRRIHNQRRPPPRWFVCRVDRLVVCAANVLFRSGRIAPVALTQDARSFLIQCGLFFGCKELSVAEPGRALQG